MANCTPILKLHYIKTFDPAPVAGTMDLLETTEYDGYYLDEWRPQVAGYKNGGEYVAPSFSDGKKLMWRNFDTTIETFNLKAVAGESDKAARQLQDLRRIGEQAADYWISPNLTHGEF